MVMNKKEKEELEKLKIANLQYKGLINRALKGWLEAIGFMRKQFLTNFILMILYYVLGLITGLVIRAGLR